jgi:hypothetical protein
MDTVLDARMFDPAPATTVEIVELPILLPAWQVSALEQAAQRQGLTAGEMVRHILGHYLGQGKSVRRVKAI